jgi:hypothetical protein
MLRTATQMKIFSLPNNNFKDLPLIVFFWHVLKFFVSICWQAAIFGILTQAALSTDFTYIDTKQRLGWKRCSISSKLYSYNLFLPGWSEVEQLGRTQICVMPFFSVVF